MYRRKTVPKWKHQALALFTGSTCLVGTIALIVPEPELVWPISAYSPVEVEKPVPYPVPAQNIDTWIDQYARMYETKEKPVSFLKYQLHCLASKESGHRHDNHTKCGDSGKACGLFQYHQSTWEMFRTKMGRSLVSRWNDEAQVETTAWALTHGYENHWGPYLRGECH